MSATNKTLLGFEPVTKKKYENGTQVDHSVGLDGWDYVQKSTKFFIFVLN